MDDASRAYWRRSLVCVAVLLSVWAIVGLGLGVLLVEPLNRISFGGFKLGFWIAHQGSIFAFVVLIAVYAVWMDRLEARLQRDRRPGGDA